MIEQSTKMSTILAKADVKHSASPTEWSSLKILATWNGLVLWTESFADDRPQVAGYKSPLQYYCIAYS